jgi:hypothetical protein
VRRDKTEILNDFQFQMHFHNGECRARKKFLHISASDKGISADGADRLGFFVLCAASRLLIAAVAAAAEFMQSRQSLDKSHRKTITSLGSCQFFSLDNFRHFSSRLNFVNFSQKKLNKF